LYTAVGERLGVASLMPVESFVAGERAMLESMLDVQREELRRLLSEVDDTQARARLVPSLTTLLGWSSTPLSWSRSGSTLA